MMPFFYDQKNMDRVSSTFRRLSHKVFRGSLAEEWREWLVLWWRLNVSTELLPLPKEFWKGPLFIHIPKAAGSSISQLPVYTVLGHKPLRYYEKRLPVGIPMPVTFAVVRSPYERVASAFFYLKKGGNNAFDRRWSRIHVSPYADLNEFVVEALAKPSIQKWMHFVPQHHFLRSSNGEIRVDHLLRFENLKNDWQTFAVKNGLPPYLPWSNWSGGGSGVLCLTKASKEIVGNIYCHDFDILKYPR